MKIEYINFDSYYATKYNNEVFNSQFNILTKYRNIHKIYLKNLELPIGFTNIRSSNNSNVLSFVINGTTYTATITPGYYNSLTSLLTALNTAISSLVSPTYTFVLSVNSTNNIVITITLVSNPATLVNYSINTTTLSIILGINTLVNTNNQATNFTNTIYNLNYDNYISLAFGNIPSVFTGSNNNILSSIKIPLNAIPYSVYYYISERQIFDQSLEIIDRNFILDNLRLTVFDRFGYQLFNGNCDFSFTLAVEYDSENINYD